MKVLFITNYPAPYRVDFFSLLGQSVDLTVLFTTKPGEQKERNQKWFNEDYSGFHAFFLRPTLSIKGKIISLEVLDYLKKDWDVIISGGYSSPTQMLAFEWMKKHKIPFYMEMDGGLIKQENAIKKAIKTHFISMPDGWYSTGKIADKYLINYGAKVERIIHYPFSSLWEQDIEDAKKTSTLDKSMVRKELGITESNVVLTVGRFIHSKAFDVLIQAAAVLSSDIGVYIVGGKPTEEYIQLCKRVKADNVHFVGFKSKEELKPYYMAADVFAMPTRSDVWGLVINEALSFGVPVVSSDQCGSGLELIQDGKNGFIVPVDDEQELAKAIQNLLNGEKTSFTSNSLQSIRDYSIEKMVQAHLNEFSKIRGMT